MPLRPAVFPPVPAIDTQPMPFGLPAKRAAIESFTNTALSLKFKDFDIGAKSSRSDSQSMPASPKVAATISLPSAFAMLRTRLIISSKLISVAAIPVRSQLAPPFAATAKILPDKSTNTA